MLEYGGVFYFGNGQGHTDISQEITRHDPARPLEPAQVVRNGRQRSRRDGGLDGYEKKHDGDAVFQLD